MKVKKTKPKKKKKTSSDFPRNPMESGGYRE